MADWLDLPFDERVVSRTASYAILQRLGAGGSAETYLAAALSGPHRGLFFALKVLRRISLSDRLQRFRDELAFLRACEHPAIMRVFDEGEIRERHPFFAAEYLPQTLAAARKKNQIQKLSYAVQLLAALDYLASQRPSAVHRDIKPRNILLKGASCILGDFGLVKRQEGEARLYRELFLESTGPRMPRYYRTPDLVEYLKAGPEPTPKSDIYQLGLVLAELFTGTNPQTPLKQGEEFTAPVSREPLGEIPGTLRAPINDLIEKMLIEDPLRRPSAEEMLKPWQDLFLVAAKREHAAKQRVL